MGTTTSSIKENLERLVASGLSEDVVLAALTTDAAELLGIDQIAGTLDAGKMGNAVVTTGPYFQEDSKVKYVFVDGEKYEFDTTESATSEVSEEAEEMLLGSWEYAINSPEGQLTGRWVFSNDGGTLTGIMTSDQGAPDADMDNLTFVGGSLTFNFDYNAGGQSVDVVISGDISDSDFMGEATIDAFSISIPLSATKVPN
mgnify:CR=1 FL=1